MLCTKLCGFCSTDVSRRRPNKCPKGLLNKADPLPPMGKMKFAGDFAAHQRDCEMLKRCLEQPESNLARRLKPTEQDFVARLIPRRPADRMCHSDGFSLGSCKFCNTWFRSKVRANQDQSKGQVGGTASQWALGSCGSSEHAL